MKRFITFMLAVVCMFSVLCMSGVEVSAAAAGESRGEWLAQIAKEQDERDAQRQKEQEEVLAQREKERAERDAERAERQNARQLVRHQSRHPQAGEFPGIQPQKGTDMERRLPDRAFLIFNKSINA